MRPQAVLISTLALLSCAKAPPAGGIQPEKTNRKAIDEVAACRAGDADACAQRLSEFVRRQAATAWAGEPLPEWSHSVTDTLRTQYLLAADPEATHTRCDRAVIPRCADEPPAVPRGSWEAMAASHARARRRPPSKPTPGTLSGRVFGRDHQPLANATVRLLDGASDWATGPGQEGVVDLSGLVSAARILQETHTDDTGEYRFDVPDRRGMGLRIAVRSPEGLSTAKHKPRAPFLEKPPTLTVRTADGSPAAGARMFVPHEVEERADEQGVMVTKHRAAVISADGAFYGLPEGNTVTLDQPMPSCRLLAPLGSLGTEPFPCIQLGDLPLDERRQLWGDGDMDWVEGHDELVYMRRAFRRDIELPEGTTWVGLRADTASGPVHYNYAFKELPAGEHPFRAIRFDPDATELQLVSGTLDVVAGEREVRWTESSVGPVTHHELRFTLPDGTPLSGLKLRASNDLGDRLREAQASFEGTLTLTGEPERVYYRLEERQNYLRPSLPIEAPTGPILLGGLRPPADLPSDDRWLSGTYLDASGRERTLDPTEFTRVTDAVHLHTVGQTDEPAIVVFAGPDQLLWIERGGRAQRYARTRPALATVRELEAVGGWRRLESTMDLASVVQAIDEQQPGPIAAEVLTATQDLLTPASGVREEAKLAHRQKTRLRRLGQEPKVRYRWGERARWPAAEVALRCDDDCPEQAERLLAALGPASDDVALLIEPSAGWDCVPTAAAPCPWTMASFTGDLEARLGRPWPGVVGRMTLDRPELWNREGAQVAVTVDGQLQWTGELTAFVQAEGLVGRLLP